MRLRVASLALILTATACGGPVAPLQVGTQTIPIAVVLGQREAVQLAPTAPAALPPPVSVSAPPIVRTLPPSAPEPRTPGPFVHPGACPEFSPADPVVAAPVEISESPAPASYPYRATVTATAGEDTDTFEGESSWTVGEASRPGVQAEYTFSVVVSLDDSTMTTTTYLVAPRGINASNETVEGSVGPLPPKPAAGLQPGMYIQSVEGPEGSVFQPSPPLLVAPFPLVTGDAFNVSATDGSTTMSYVLSVGERGKVNACGTPLQGWKLDMTDGRYDTVAANGTQQSAMFTRSMTIATQFGGLILDDQSQIEGTTFLGGNVTRSEHFTINVEPEPAAP